MTPEEEAELVVRARAKDAEGRYTPDAVEARGELVAAYTPMMRRVAFTSHLSPEDLLSALTISFLEQIDTHKPDLSRLATRMRPVTKATVRKERKLQRPEPHATMVMYPREDVTMYLAVLDDLELKVITLAYGFMDRWAVDARLAADLPEDECVTDRAMQLVLPEIRSKATATRIRTRALEKMRNVGYSNGA